MRYGLQQRRPPQSARLGSYGAQTTQLPSPVHGLRYTFQIRAAQALTIQTDAGNHYILALNSAQTSLTHLAANELYAEVTLEGLYDLNAGQVYWRVVNMRGTWT
jgi:hypothetical protein